MEWNNCKNIEIYSDKNKYILNGNQIILLKFKLLKGFILDKGKCETIMLKIKELNLGIGEEIRYLTIKEAEKITVNSVSFLSQQFDLLYYEENSKTFINVKKGNIEQLFNNNRCFSKCIIYPFDIFPFKQKIFDFTFNHKSLRINRFLKLTKSKYYHLNKSGEIIENEVKPSDLNDNILNYKGESYVTKIFFNNWKCIFFVTFQFENIKYLIWIDSIKDMEESKYNKIFENDINTNYKLDFIQNFEIKNYEKDFDNNIPFLNFSHLISLIVKHNTTIESIEKSLIIYLDESKQSEFKNLKGNLKDKDNTKLSLTKFNIIKFMYKTLKENRNKFTKDCFEENLLPENELKNKRKELIDSLYFYKNENINKEKKLFNNKEINTIVDKIKRIQCEPYKKLQKNIYLIHDKSEPEVKGDEIIKENNNDQNEIDELELNSQSEPPPFKSKLELNKQFSNIKELIEIYNNYISDTKILPLHLIKLIYNKTLEDEFKKIYKIKLEKRFTILLSIFKDLKFELEDNCIIYRIIQDFKESMNDMLLKFEKGKTNFKELIPNITLNKKALNKVFIITERPKFKLDIKKWRITNIEKNQSLFTRNKILYFQKGRKKKINDEEEKNDNILLENEKDENIVYENKKDKLKITHIDSKQIKNQENLNIQLKDVVNYDSLNKKINESKNDDNKEKDEKEKDINENKIKKIKAIKRSSDDAKEINNLQKPLDMNPNMPESEIDYQIKLIIDKMKNIKQNEDFKIEKEPIKKHLISEEYFDRNYNNEEIFNKIIELSEPISSEIIIELSKKNLKEFIPFKELEVNLLIDCSRYISDDAKYFNIIIICGIAMALNALKIKYSLGLIGDYSFKIELKKIIDEHNLDYLKMALDCIFLPRLMTYYASCLNYVIDKFETRNKISSQRVFIIISNGLDKELRLTKKWKEKFFSNENHSFLFLFNEPKLKEKEILEFLRNDIWEPFKNPKDTKYKSTVRVMNFKQVIDKDFKKKYLKI